MRHAVHQADRMLAAVRGQHVQHGQERRDAGAARQEQHGASHLAQVEAAVGAGEGNRLAGLRLLAQELAHAAVGHVAHHKRSARGAGGRAERVRAGQTGARDFHVDILPRQEGRCGGLAEVDRECDGGVRQLVHRRQLALEAGHARLARGRRRRHLDHAIRARARLAGQHIALGGFLGRQGVFDIARLKQVVLAGLAQAAAGAAGAVAAVQRDIDLLAIGGVGQGFIGGAGDEAGNAVFKLQGDVVLHGVVPPARPLRCDRCR